MSPAFATSTLCMKHRCQLSSCVELQGASMFQILMPSMWGFVDGAQFKTAGSQVTFEALCAGPGCSPQTCSSAVPKGIASLYSLHPCKRRSGCASVLHENGMSFRYAGNSNFRWCSSETHPYSGACLHSLLTMHFFIRFDPKCHQPPTAAACKV